VDERGQRVRVQRPPDTPELTKSVKAARADTTDVTINAQIRGNVDAEQERTRLLATAVSAPDLSTFQRCAAVTRADEQQFCLDGHIWPKNRKLMRKPQPKNRHAQKKRCQ